MPDVYFAGAADSSLILVIRTGGLGGFFASVRDIGATGQQQQASRDSAEEAVRGGAGGFFFSRGGGTKPFSLVPSSAETIVPVQRVAARAVLTIFLAIIFFIFFSVINLISQSCLGWSTFTRLR
jgi:hypothetical protein